MSFREDRIESGRCPSCELMRINGILCHEIGCPDSHLFMKHECKECGKAFEPENKNQEYCSPHCYRMDNGYDCDCDFCIENEKEYQKDSLIERFGEECILLFFDYQNLDKLNEYDVEEMNKAFIESLPMESPNLSEYSGEEYWLYEDERYNQVFIFRNE